MKQEIESEKGNWNILNRMISTILHISFSKTAVLPFNCWHFNPYSKELTLVFNPFAKEYNDETGCLKEKDIVGTGEFNVDYFVKLTQNLAPNMIFKPIINPMDIKFTGEITPEIISLLEDWKNADHLYGYSGKQIMVRFLNYPDNIWRSVYKPITNIFISPKTVLRKFNSSHGYYSGIIANAYMTSFFKTISVENIYINDGHNPFESGIKLIEMGLIPMKHKGKWILCNYNGIVYRERRPMFHFMKNKGKVKE